MSIREVVSVNQIFCFGLSVLIFWVVSEGEGWARLTTEYEGEVGTLGAIIFVSTATKRLIDLASFTRY